MKIRERNGVGWGGVKKGGWKGVMVVGKREGGM